MQSRALFLASLLAVCTPIARADDGLRGRIFVEGVAGRALMPFLGSEDLRSAHGFGIGVVLPGWRRLRYRGFVPETLLQVYYFRSTAPDAPVTPRNGTDAYGVLALSRYTSPRKGGRALYVDVGIGFQYADMRTVDLSGRGSFTPTLGLGLSYKPGFTEWLIGARLFHISNAALAGNNQGQNQLLVTLGVRF